jgi:heme/copper-type cytochrome/quinol oxidase subunit 2
MKLLWTGHKCKWSQHLSRMNDTSIPNLVCAYIARQKKRRSTKEKMERPTHMKMEEPILVYILLLIIIIIIIIIVIVLLSLHVYKYPLN